MTDFSQVVVERCLSVSIAKVVLSLMELANYVFDSLNRPILASSSQDRANQCVVTLSFRQSGIGDGFVVDLAQAWH